MVVVLTGGSGFGGAARALCVPQDWGSWEHEVLHFAQKERERKKERQGREGRGRGKKRTREKERGNSRWEMRRWRWDLNY